MFSAGFASFTFYFISMASAPTAVAIDSMSRSMGGTSHADTRDLELETLGSRNAMRMLV